MIVIAAWSGTWLLATCRLATERSIILHYHWWLNSSIKTHSMGNSSVVSVSRLYDGLTDVQFIPLPICSMYGTFTNMCPKNQPNVGKYTIHGAYGLCRCFVCEMENMRMIGGTLFLDWPNLVGGDWTWILWLSINWELHHPNWRTPSFFRGVGLNHQPAFFE